MIYQVIKSIYRVTKSLYRDNKLTYQDNKSAKGKNYNFRTNNRRTKIKNTNFTVPNTCSPANKSIYQDIKFSWLNIFMNNGAVSIEEYITYKRMYKSTSCISQTLFWAKLAEITQTLI